MKEAKDPTIIVIFGAGGDLTQRKLIPALYNLYLDGWLPAQFAILGVDLKEMDNDAFRESLRQGVDAFSRQKTEDDSWHKFSEHITYDAADLTSQHAYDMLSQKLGAFSKQWAARARTVFYLAVAPFLIESITAQLHKAKLMSDRQRSRLVVEKPFGHDLTSAQVLNKMLTQYFAESQIYRIDHYLGKETVQNILAFRFANALFEPIWDRRYIDHVQITVAEQVGVGHRGGYYDHAGALRDMIQNHLLQIMCLTAMEPPVSFAADEIRNKKVDVLRAVRPIAPEQVPNMAVRGQYGSGWVRGEQEPAYQSVLRTFGWRYFPWLCEGHESGHPACCPGLQRSPDGQGICRSVLRRRAGCCPKMKMQRTSRRISAPASNDVNGRCQDENLIV